MRDKSWENRVRLISGEAPEEDRLEFSVKPAKLSSLYTEYSAVTAADYAAALGAGRGSGKSKLAASLMSSFEPDSDFGRDDQLLGSSVLPLITVAPTDRAKLPIYLLPNGEVTLNPPEGEERLLKIGYARMTNDTPGGFGLIADVTLPPDKDASDFQVNLNLPVSTPQPESFRDKLIFFELE